MASSSNLQYNIAYVDCPAGSILYSLGSPKRVVRLVAAPVYVALPLTSTAIKGRKQGNEIQSRVTRLYGYSRAMTGLGFTFMHKTRAINISDKCK